MAVGVGGGAGPGDERLAEDVRCLLRAMAWISTEGYDAEGTGRDGLAELAGALLERYGVERLTRCLSALVVPVVLAMAAESSCPVGRVAKRLASKWRQPRLQGWLRRATTGGGAGSPPAGCEMDAVLALAGMHVWGCVWLLADPGRRPGVLVM